MTEEDIIEKVTEMPQEERTATGEVNGIEVKLEKSSYRGMIKTLWKVQATSDTGYTKKEEALAHEEADEKFEELKERYGLKE